ncbi:hypothetical protein [Methylobacter sp. YRD-M1]|uniref:hypothetical protein n=1 Tax=Methylobacter sp. YRD-M1 TaxID=2911520 RepID=UPI00227CA484|nr:hypothetical protein [Methylobacter sp. YRD-M1]WAK03828.1 hypothetical protein LZ558_08600 [Methylobacter sp. YRD-M1]
MPLTYGLPTNSGKPGLQICLPARRLGRELSCYRIHRILPRHRNQNALDYRGDRNIL